MQIIKEFKGHSGSKVELINDNGSYYVRKTGTNKLKKSAELLISLSKIGFHTPKIFSYSDDEIIMEYINGVDMKTFILSADKEQIDSLLNFINSYISKSITNNNVSLKESLEKKLDDISKSTDLSALTFTPAELLDKLPKIASIGLIHGDFTLDNILFFKDNFYFIDANPTDINSIIFDANKIRQDLECFWFIRNDTDKLYYTIVCSQLLSELKNNWEFLNDNYILIFMLLRILPYCKNNEDTKFLIKEINKLWQ